MKLQQLKYILEIADCQSITGASKKLYVSQPYLSKVVADMESRLNQRIFVRRNNGVELTTYGKKVYLLAQSIINQMELLENMENKEALETGSTRLSFSVANFIMKESVLLDYFSTSHVSGNDVNFYETSIEECVDNVEREEAEFALVVADDFQKALLQSVSARKGFCCRELDESPAYFHLHINHPLAEEREIRMEHLTQYPLVQLKTDQYTRLSREKLKEKYPDIYVPRRMAVSNYHCCLSIIKHKGAFMIGNKWQISELEKTGILSVRIASFDRRVHLMLLRKVDLSFSPEAERFLRMFKDSYGLNKI